MLMDNLNNIFVVAAIAIGTFPILLEWTYVLEALRGIYILDFTVYRHYINSTFAMSAIMLVFLWLTNLEMSTTLLRVFVSLMVVWFVTAVLCLILSVCFKIKQENKKAIRMVLFPCVKKVLWLVVLLWIIY